MSFPRYAKYKDSGVEWLGEVPEHWAVCALSYRYDVQLGKMLDEKRITGDHLGPYLRNVDVQWGRINSDELPEMDFREEDLVRYSLKTGDLLVCEGGEVGRAAVWRGEREPCFYQKALHRLRAANPSRDTAEFAFYLMAAASALGLFAQGEAKTTIAHLPAEALRRYCLPFPPLAHQHAIVGFLDRETAKIDALVTEQERLIGLLKEKRQAVISHAVTKGLDPRAPMKDSGVEWLGEVPAHWNVASVGYRYEVQLGRMLNEDRSTGENMRRYLRVFDVQWHTINVEDLPSMDFPPEAQARYKLLPGDLLVNEGGSYVGRSAIWRGEIEECYYQKALHRLRPLTASDTAEFLLNVMEMATHSGVFVAAGNQTTIDHLTAEQLRAHRFAFPPVEEQRQIVKALKKYLEKLRMLLAEAEAGTVILKERRSALISAAVTGKIDVRGLVAAEAEAA